MAGLPRIYWRNYDSSDNTTYQTRTNMMHQILFTIEECGFSAPAGKVFKEWNDTRDGTGTSYQAGETTDTHESVYAIWESVDISISYAGSQIATMNSSGTKTLLTSGKYCTDNITIDYTKAGITVVETLDSHGGTIVSISGDPVTSLQAKTVIPTSQSQTISADSGYDAISEVLVQGDNNLVSSNIASGISIFGVVGTFAGGGGAASFIQSHGTMTSYEDSTVTTIGQGAFAFCSDLQTASFPVCTSIEAYAFYNCSSLSTINFPSCTRIGSSAFYNCYKLVTVSFPYCTTIGTSAFNWCYNLTTASFPVCTTISSYAFTRCSSLTTISFPACTAIGSYAFMFCIKLTTANFSVCTSINDYAFSNCSSLTTVSFPVCTTIRGYAFTRCYNLSSIYFISCTSIGASAFQYCSSLTNAFFPVCTTIGDNAFQYCSSLTTIDFPSCTTLGNNAFANCSGLRDITLLACKHIKAQAFSNCFSLMSVRLPLCETISSSAFFGCRMLLSVRLAGPSVVYLASSNAFSGTPIAGYTAYTQGEYGSIFVPSSLYNAYINDSIWSVFSSRFVRYY